MSLQALPLAFGLAASWLVVYAVSRKVDLKRFGVEIHPFYALYRTERFNEALRGVARAAPALWRVLGNLSVTVGAGLAAYATFFLAKNLFGFVYFPETAIPVTPIIPGLTIDLRSLPYVIPAATLAIVAHEGSHGIAICNERIRLKSAGAFLLVMVPGGFVEPDEKAFEQGSPIARLRVLSAGSFSNLVVGLITLMVLVNFSAVISPAFASSSTGVMLVGIVEGSPAEIAGLKEGDVIYAINGTDIAGVDDLAAFMLEVEPGGYVTLSTSEGDLQPIRTVASGRRAVMGVYTFDYHRPKIRILDNRFGRMIPYHLLSMLFWSYLLSFSVAMFNMLPIYPMDGDGFFSTLLKKWLGDGASRARWAMNLLFFALVFSNVMLSMLRFGLKTV